MLDPKRTFGDRQGFRKLGLYTAIPTMMMVGPVLGFFLGSWLEGRYGHEPWLVFGGVVLGVVASIRQIIVILRRGERPPRDR